MDTVETLTVIRTTLTRRGTGKDEHSPVRILTQYWTPEGKGLVEIDPCAITLTPEELHELRNTFLTNNCNPDLATAIINRIKALGKP